MNKKLIALAIAGASVVPAAMAQSANPVTLYGRVYVTAEQIEASGGGVADLERRTRIEDQASLLGVRGTEDLGGGLKAFFQLETGWRPDQNTSAFATRNSGIGLRGGWGSFLIGRWDMPFKSANIAIDAFGDLTISGLTGVMEDIGNFDRRDQNVAQYWSPNFAGLAVRLAGTANEGKTATANPRDYGASITYNRGPLYLEYSYEEHRDPAAGRSKDDGNALGGKFSFGPIRLGLLYQEFRKDGFEKQKAWMGNVVWTIGKNQLIYQYMQAKDGGVNGAATQPDCNSNSLGYQYNFTKRTSFVGSWTKVDNNEASKCSFGANRPTIAAGQDPEGFSLGLKHVF